MAAGGPATRRLLRPAAVAVLVLLLAAQVVRSALVGLPYERRPAAALALWPSNPTILAEQSMVDIGTAAGRGQAVPASTLAAVDLVARRAPLAPDPFLIRGAIAQSEGRAADAERLFIAARARDPRSRAARYFLADRYFRQDRVADGLIEMAALTRLEPKAAAPFVPALAAYAATPGAIAHLKTLFRRLPQVESPVLLALADDANNAGLVLALASPGAGPPPEWHGRLIMRLVEKGDYARAHSIWRRLSGVRTRGGLFNPAFADLPAAPPFNWSYPTTADGVAEPGEGGRLEILYYGRARAVLASQLLVLPAGGYRLAMQLPGRPQGDGLEWAVRCAGSEADLLRLRLSGEAALGRFSVPAAACAAQWLELRGLPGDFPRTVEATIAGLRLEAENRR